MGKAIEYYRFQYPLTHIDLKIFKHNFSEHCSSNSAVRHLNIKILKLTDIVPALAMYIQDQRVGKKVNIEFSPNSVKK